MASSGLANLLTDRRLQSEVAQVTAKGVLVELTGTSPSFQWTYSAERLAKNMSGAALDVEGVARSGEAIGQLSGVARLVARAWESLAKLQEGASRELAILNSAAAYELAGFQANAACLARQLYRATPDIPPDGVAELVLVFLQRYLLQVRAASTRFTSEPDLKLPIELLSQVAAEGLLAKGIDQVSRYLLAGDEPAFEGAIQMIERAGRGFLADGLVDQANLALILRSLLPVVHARSTWHVIGGSLDAPLWNRYLKLLSRGGGRSVVRSPSVSELWPSQLAAIEEGLLADESSKVVRMPTSAGKTRVAEMAIVHQLLSQPGSKCVYVAPYRALAGEIEEAFVHLLSDLGLRVSSVIGTYESDAFEQALVADAHLLVLTPEKLDLLHRVNTEALNDVRLIVIDEGHIIDDGARGLKFELLMTRLKRRLPEARFLFLSAVVPDETLRDLAQWLAADPSAVISSSWRPSVLRVARFEWLGPQGVIRYAESDDAEGLAGFVPGVIRENVFEIESPRSNRILKRAFPDTTSKAQTAAELAFKFAEVGSVLVFCPQRNLAIAVGTALLQRLEYAAASETVPGYFQGHTTESHEAAKEWLGAEHLTTRLANQGIGLHHGRLPIVVRRAVEGDMRRRQLRVVIATNTLAQGVNLPIRTVVMHSCRRRVAGGQSERLSARDYWNIAGRAGRAREETEGLIVHITTTRQDRQDFSDFLEERSRLEPVRSALLQMVREIAAGRLSVADASTALDPEVLALMVEEGVTSADDEDRLASVLAESLAGIQTTSQADLSQLQHLMEGVSQSIRSRTSAETRSVYSPTGLRSDSCDALQRFVAENEAELRRLLVEAGPGDLAALSELAVRAAMATTEGQPQAETSANHLDLLNAWLTGVAIEEIAAGLGAMDNLEALTGFVEDFFAYRLPWVTGALLRVAAPSIGVVPAEMSTYAAFLPSMIRSGVPTPEATWALSAGVSSRSAAIEISGRYLQDATQSTYQSFIAWLGRTSTQEEAVSSATRRNISESVARTVSNAYLVDFQGLQGILPIEVALRGTQYSEGKGILGSIRADDVVGLRRDYENLIDRNAVEVLIGGRAIGYLPRDLAQLLAPEIDVGERLTAAISAVSEEGSEVQVRIGLA